MAALLDFTLNLTPLSFLCYNTGSLLLSPIALKLSSLSSSKLITRSNTLPTSFSRHYFPLINWLTFISFTFFSLSDSLLFTHFTPHVETSLITESSPNFLPHTQCAACLASLSSLCNTLIPSALLALLPSHHLIILSKMLFIFFSGVHASSITCGDACVVIQHNGATTSQLLLIATTGVDHNIVLTLASLDTGTLKIYSGKLEKKMLCYKYYKLIYFNCFVLFFIDEVG